MTNIFNDIYYYNKNSVLKKLTDTIEFFYDLGNEVIIEHNLPLTDEKLIFGEDCFFESNHYYAQASYNGIVCIYKKEIYNGKLCMYQFQPSEPIIIN